MGLINSKNRKVESKQFKTKKNNGVNDKISNKYSLDNSTSLYNEQETKNDIIDSATATNELFSLGKNNIKYKMIYDSITAQKLNETTQLDRIFKLYVISKQIDDKKTIAKCEMFIQLLKTHSDLDVNILENYYQKFDINLNYFSIKKILTYVFDKSIKNRPAHIEAVLELDLIRDALYQWANSIQKMSAPVVPLYEIKTITFEYLSKKYLFNKFGKEQFNKIWQFIWNDYNSFI